jgi:pimeloyl-ACP methyl ester carboxylesterase
MASDLTQPPAQVEPVKPVNEYDIRGGGGITLHAREWGNPDGPAILFIHGWSQCDLCWSGQVSSQLATSFRMVTLDNRGHGTSGKPHKLDPGCAEPVSWVTLLTGTSRARPELAPSGSPQQPPWTRSGSSAGAWLSRP